MNSIYCNTIHFNSWLFCFVVFFCRSLSFSLNIKSNINTSELFFVVADYSKLFDFAKSSYRLKIPITFWTWCNKTVRNCVFIATTLNESLGAINFGLQILWASRHSKKNIFYILQNRQRPPIVWTSLFKL